ncbi:LysR substrate-binding domain-containing protein, partial [Psychrobacter sp. SIMBA_152]
NLRFDLDFSDRRIDLIEEGYELAIRSGELQDSSYQAKKLTLIRCVICASPDYLARMGMPETLDYLDNHALLQYSLGQTNSINLVDTEGRSHHR